MISTLIRYIIWLYFIIDFGNIIYLKINWFTIPTIVLIIKSFLFFKIYNYNLKQKPYISYFFLWKNDKVICVRINRSFKEISWVSMGFYMILCLRVLLTSKNSYCMIIKDYLSIVSKRFYTSIIYIISQNPWLLKN